MKHSILIVDDDLAIRALLESLFESEGFDTILADDGRAGVREAQSHLPDVIIMDVDMPILNGIDATAILKSDPRTENIRIIMMSALDPRLFKVSYFQPDAFVAKPFDLDDVLRLVSDQIYSVSDYPNPSGHQRRYTVTFEGRTIQVEEDWQDESREALTEGDSVET